LEQLGHDDWQCRQEAEKSLLDIGPEAAPLLREAAAYHVDVEVRLRASRILQVLPSEMKFQKALDFLDGQSLGKARTLLASIVELSLGSYRAKARHLLKIIDSIAKVFDGYDRGYRGFRSWYDQYFEEDKNQKIFTLGIAYNNIYLSLLSEGRRSVSNFQKAERYFWMIIEEETTRKNRRVASCYAALLSAAGMVTKGQRVLAKVNHIPPVSFLDYFDLASFWAYASKPEKAIPFLRLGLLAAEESGFLSFAKHWARESNDFDGLRDVPAFEELVRD